METEIEDGVFLRAIEKLAETDMDQAAVQMALKLADQGNYRFAFAALRLIVEVAERSGGNFDFSRVPERAVARMLLCQDNLDNTERNGLIDKFFCIYARWMKTAGHGNISQN